MPICPFLKKYIDSIAIVETENYKASIDHLVQLMSPLKLEAVVLHGKTLSYVSMKNLVSKANAKYKKQDFEILMMHPDTEECPLPLEYTYEHSPLVILQRRSTLQNARKLLESKTKYYDYYK